MNSIDDHMYLRGDEDGTVELWCRTCDPDTGPVTRYDLHDRRPAYDDTPVIHAVHALIEAAHHHTESHCP